MRALLSTSIVLLAASTAAAEVLELKDGTTVVGAYIGEADGAITVLPLKGKERQIDRAEVKRIDWSHKVPAPLAKKASRARARFVKKRQREVAKLLNRYGRAKTDDERTQLAARVGTYSPNVQLKPLSDALGDTKAATRSFAVQRLATLGESKAVAPLVRTALTTKHKDLRSAAHAAALAVDASLTRQFYESVAASRTKPIRRVKALGHLGAMKQRDSVPGLVLALEHVNAEIRATLATAGGVRRVPVNLGTIGGAGVNVPVELPEASLIEVQTNVTVPALRSVHGAAIEALRAITGKDLGDDPAAWKRWWERQPKAD